MNGPMSSILGDFLELIKMVKQNSPDNHSFLLSYCRIFSNVEHSVDSTDVVEYEHCNSNCDDYGYPVVGFANLSDENHSFEVETHFEHTCRCSVEG
jgi:hypothetical protein